MHMARKAISIEMLEKASPSGVVAGEIRRMISSGKLAPGKRLASERALEKLFGVTRNAVRNGLRELEREGLIKCVGRSRTVLKGPDGAADVSVQGSTVAILMDQALSIQEFLSTPSSGWSNAVSAGAVSEAFADGKSICLIPTGKSDPRSLYRLVNVVPAGVLVISGLSGVSSREETLRSMGLKDVPLVAYGDVNDWSDCDKICSDHRQGTFDLTSWLIARGARRILRVNPRQIRQKWTTWREEGFKDACGKAGIPVLPPLEIPSNPAYEFTMESFDSESHKMAGYLFKALGASKPPDAIMALSDGYVFKIAAALRILGRDPRKILITGYDNYWKDLPDLKWENSPPAATVDKENVSIGRELARFLARRMSGELKGPHQTVMVPQRLVVSGE